MDITLKTRGLALLVLLASVTVGCAEGPQKSPRQAAADKALAQQVQSSLSADPNHYFRHVNVRVDDGVVRLSGYVWSQPAMNRAKQLAGEVPGVVRVDNQMELERNGNRGNGDTGT